MNIVGTICVCVTRWRSISSSAPGGVEPLHDDRRAAEAVDRHAEAQRRGVVQRGGRQVDGVRRRSRTAARAAARRRAACRAGRGAARPRRLRAAGRARRVEEVDALGLVVERLGRLPADQRRRRPRARSGPVDGDRARTRPARAAAARATSAVAALANSAARRSRRGCRRPRRPSGAARSPCSAARRAAPPTRSRESADGSPS